MQDRKTFDDLRERKTEKWMVGWANKGSIYLLNGKKYKTESDHTYDEKKYIALIKHELSHLFFNILSKDYVNPRWLAEGLAIYISGQNKFKKRPEKFNNFLQFYKIGGARMYAESGFVVELLVKKFGKPKILKLVKSLKETKTKTAFNKKFLEIYGFKLSYKAVNDLYK